MIVKRREKINTVAIVLVVLMSNIHRKSSRAAIARTSRGVISTIRRLTSRGCE